MELGPFKDHKTSVEVLDNQLGIETMQTATIEVESCWYAR